MKNIVSLQQRTELKLNPQLLLSIKLLNLPLTELRVYAEHAVDINPLLELKSQEPAYTGDGGSGYSSSNSYDDDDQDYEFRYSDYSYRRHQQVSLGDYLLEQLVYADLSAEEQQIGRLIIGSLDKKGYFREDIADLVVMFKCSAAQFRKVLETIKQFEPAGVATANMEECLCSQLDPLDEEYPLLKILITSHLQRLAKRDMVGVANDLGIDMEHLRKLVLEIGRLRPFPAQGFADNNQSQYIVPDVTIEQVGDGFQALLPEDWLIAVRSDYSELWSAATAADDKQAIAYLRDKKSQADQLLQAIAWRRRTIGLVADYIVKYQQGFFRNGYTHLRPMSLAQVADALSLHPATISRAISHKYFYTPQGVLPGKFFFHQSLPSVEGFVVSSTWVKYELKKLIDEENKKHPLSDRTLAQRLIDEQGVIISRRTVAKYREGMGIGNQSERRRC